MLSKGKLILGVHYGHDATIVLMKDGRVLEAMSEERLSRQKKHCGFPHLALEYLEHKYDFDRKNIEQVCVVGEKLEEGSSLFLTLEENKDARVQRLRVRHYARSLGFYFPILGRVFALRDKLLLRKVANKKVKEKVDIFITSTFPRAEINYIHHHDAHAWAFLPFTQDLSKKRLIFTLDGAGDEASGSVSLYEAGDMRLLQRFSLHDSLGLYYSAVVDILGMKRNEHEFKVMGLAPYAKVKDGEKVYEKLKNCIYFNRETLCVCSKFDAVQMTSYFIANEFQTEHRFDSLAYGIQKLTEELITEMVLAYCEKYDVYDIAVGGGVFMNVKANQKVLELPQITSLVSVPSCGDESLAIGAAMYLTTKLDGLTQIESVHDIYWGSEYDDECIKQEIKKYEFSKKCTVEYFDRSKGLSIERKVAELLAENSVVGRFSGRAEWGARALGNRSILANPSSKDNVKLINEMIKNRDFWMPFATSLLQEKMNEYLILKKECNAPYMSITYDTQGKAYTDLIAAIHPYDYTSRPQIVSKKMNPQYHVLISHFEELTGIGGVLNTSFNLHGEPNVEAPIDALRTFEHSGLPYLALGNFLISKNK